MNDKTFQQNHPTFWLEDHLPACSNKNDESSVEEEKETQFNHDLPVDSDDNNEEVFSEKENHETRDFDMDSDSETNNTPLSKLCKPTYQTLIQ
jgi:hypothetical protein